MDTFSEGGQEIRRFMGIQKKLAENARAEEQKFRPLPDEPQAILRVLAGRIEAWEELLSKGIDRKEWGIIEYVRDHLKDTIDELAAKGW